MDSFSAIEAKVTREMMNSVLLHLSGVLILLFLPLLMSVPDGGAAVLLLLILVSLIGLSLNRARISLSRDEYLFLAALGFYIAVYAINVWMFGSEISELDNTSRFLLLLPVFFYLRKVDLNPQYFFYGIFLGAVACFAIAFYQKFLLDMPRVQGVTKIVSFGGMSMTLAMIALVVAVMKKSWIEKVLFSIAFILACSASVLSLARGSWLVLITGILALLVLNPLRFTRRARIMVGIGAFLLIASTYGIPPVSERVDVAVSDVVTYFEENNVRSSVGVRIEIWRLSLQESIKKPYLGFGEGNFKLKMKELGDAGKADSYILVHSHAHNEYISALLLRGLPGLMSVLLIFLIPLYMFNKARIGRNSEQILAVSGIVFIVSIMTVSLSDIYFQQHKLTLFFIFIIYVLSAMLAPKISDTRNLEKKS